MVGCLDRGFDGFDWLVGLSKIVDWLFALIWVVWWIDCLNDQLINSLVGWQFDQLMDGWMGGRIDGFLFYRLAQHSSTEGPHSQRRVRIFMRRKSPAGRP